MTLLDETPARIEPCMLDDTSAEIVGRKLDSRCSDVLFEAVQLRRAWNRNNPRLLSKQPGECDLSWSRFLPLPSTAEKVDQCLVRLEGFRRETGKRAAEVGAVEGGVFVDRAGEESFSQRAVGHETDAEFLEGRDHFLFRGPRPE